MVNNALIKNPTLEIEEIRNIIATHRHNLPNTAHQYPFTNSLLRHKACMPFLSSKTNAYSDKLNQKEN